MWHVNNLEIKPATLDFSSSGQAKREVSQLVSGELQLINAIELVDWDSEDTQFLICEACGITHCKSGDWVSIRRSNSLILILPASEYVWGERSQREEYSPPDYLKRHGLASLDLSTYEGLRSQHSSIPPVASIRQLNMREATLLFHWNAPLQLLGEPPEVKVHTEAVIASSEGDCLVYLKQLESLIQKQYSDMSDAALRPIADTEQILSFYLDLAGFSEWKAQVFDGSEHRLLVDERFVIERQSTG
jgi:hypothetical protein